MKNSQATDLSPGLRECGDGRLQGGLLTVRVLARFAYNGCMARGWESKSIEEQQISAAEDKEHDRAKQASTASQIERRKQKEGLLLERARIVRQIQGGHKRGYLELLERALAHVEQELSNLEAVASRQ